MHIFGATLNDKAPYMDAKWSTALYENFAGNILFKIVNDVHFYSLQSAPASVFTHWNVNSFISLVMICLIVERIMLQRWKVKLK